jgi:uncharacterized membrane protein YfcA
MLQQILSTALLIAGLLYGLAILVLSWRDRARMAEEKGSWPALAAAEFLIYVCASVGISDFLPNTLLVKNARLASDRELPGTLVGCGLLPGAIIASSLLRTGTPVSSLMLILCGACVATGSAIGARLVSRFDGGVVRRIMLAALILSVVVLIGRMFLSAGADHTATSLPLPVLLLAAALCLITAAVNMFGIPMKATWTAMFLILGLSPMTALTLVLVLASLTPISGGVSVLKNGLYHRRAVLCSTLFGSAGALVGTAAAVSLPANVLNVILLVVMAIAIVTMAKK